MVSIAADLTARVVIITFIYAIISYFVTQRYAGNPGQLAIVVPLLSVMFGVVILISVLFDLRRFRVWNTRL